jgi:S1-C subfamily serine protease
LKVSQVDPGTAAEKAGLQAGDVIQAINGYQTVQPGNLAWILGHAAPDRILNMKVCKVGDRNVHPVQAQLSVGPVDTSRPSYLPPVGLGPPPATR